MQGELRDRARLTASLTLAFIAFIIPVAAIAPRVANPGVPLHHDGLFQAGATATVLLLVAYGLVRSRWPQLGIVGLPWGAMVAAWQLVLFGHHPPWEGAADFLVFIPALASLTNTRRSSVFLWLVTLGAFALFAVLHDHRAQEHVVTLVLLLVLPPLLILGSELRDRQQRVIQEQARHLQQDEQDLQALLEYAPQAIVASDLSGRIRFANAPASTLLGYSKAELLRMQVDELVPVGERAGHAAHRAEYARAPEPRIMGANRDLHAQRKDGSLVAVEIGLNMVNAASGQLVVASIVDLTNRKRAEALERKAAQHQAELDKAAAVAKFRVDLMDMVAHELKTPLTPLRLQMRIVQRMVPPGKEEQWAASFAVLDRNFGRLNDQINHMLEASRLEAGTTKLALRPTDLGKLVQSAVETYRPVAAEAQLALDLEGPGEASVMADEARIAQVLDNLISNAIKYTPSGGRIRVTLAPTTMGLGWSVHVADTGLGLTADQLPRLFQPFGKVHQPVRRSSASTGLGLFISKGIVELHGGRMTVTSEGAGKGSTFGFELPVAATAAKRA